MANKKKYSGEPSAKELKSWGFTDNRFTKASANIQRRKDTMGILQRMKHGTRKRDIYLGPKKGKRDYSIIGKVMRGYKTVKELGKKKDNPGHSY